MIPSTSIFIDESFLWTNLNEQLYNMPNPEQELFDGIRWDSYGKIFTPAYWKAQYIMHNYNNDFSIKSRLGENILEEVVACLLGGFGLKSENGLAAFKRLKKRKLIQKGVSFSALLESLKDPLTIDNKIIHYRFPNQKAKFIYAFLNREDLDTIPTKNDVELRNWLLSNIGIGPKTASWITRNYLQSENVAIIDIHIYRACVVMGLFSQTHNIQKDYFKLEQLFLKFCRELDVQPSKMDALIWFQMKEFNRIALKIINNQQNQKLCQEAQMKEVCLQ